MWMDCDKWTSLSSQTISWFSQSRAWLSWPAWLNAMVHLCTGFRVHIFKLRIISKMQEGIAGLKPHRAKTNRKSIISHSEINRKQKGHKKFFLKQRLCCIRETKAPQNTIRHNSKTYHPVHFWWDPCSTHVISEKNSVNKPVHINLFYFFHYQALMFHRKQL